jgi:inosine-uridine nucleoside N-ribohydrolase
MDRRPAAWLLLAGLILVCWLIFLPLHLQGIATDWNISGAASALGQAIPAGLFLAYVLGLQLLGAAFFLLASVAIFRQVIQTGKSRRTPAFLTSLIFLVVPLFLYLNAFEPTGGLPGFWNQVRGFLINFSLVAGIGGYLGLFFLLPYGAWRPRWSGWLALLLLGGLATTLVIMLNESLGDQTWGVFMFTLLFGMVAGWLVQLIRYWRIFSPQERGQTRWIVTALAVNPLLILGLVISDPAVSGSAWFSLVALHLQLILPALIPLAVLNALARRNLRDAQPPTRLSRAYLLPGLLVFAVLASVAAGIQYRDWAAAPDPTQPWTLAPGAQPVPLIVDTDLGNDDVLALLFLMQHPGVDLQAITVVGTGLVHCAPGVRNVHGLLELTGYAEIPVSCGREMPLDADHAFPAPWRTAADNLWGLGLPVNDRQPDPRPAPELLAEMLAGQEQPVTFLAVGPLTNLAAMIETHPEAVQKIKRLYIMGGAVEVPGNVYDESLGLENKTAEWNFYADPLAARRVFESDIPITLVPLDATNFVAVNMPLFRLLQQHHPTRAATFAFNIFYINQGWIQSGFYYLWDTLAAAVLTNPEIAGYQEFNLEVVTERGPDFGRTRIAPQGPAVQVAVRPDARLFEEIFLRVLNTE